MRECELCDLPARMFCESDEASLCWDCDSKVHSANFLVARHSRCLLCNVCQLPTPWKASGEKLGPTVSICQRCVGNCNGRGKERNQEEAEEEEEESGAGNDEDGDEDEEEIEESDPDDDDDDVEDGDDEDEENQVVPGPSTPPPPVSSSSSSDESSSKYCSTDRDIDETYRAISLKRRRENADQDDLACSSSHYNPAMAAETAATTRADEEATSFRFSRPPKDCKRDSSEQSTQSESKPVQLIDSLRRFQQDILSSKTASSTILEICKLSKDPMAIASNFHNR